MNGRPAAQRALSFVLTVAILVAALFVSRDFLTDRLVSLVLSRRLGISVECRGVCLRGPRVADFLSLEVYSKKKHLFLSSAEGRIAFGKYATSLFLNRIVIQKEICKEFSLKGLSQWLRTNGRTVSVESLRLVVDDKKDGRVVHFLIRGEKDPVYLRGGIKFALYHLLKGHALVRIPEHWIEKIPSLLYQGGIKKADGWGEFKIFAKQNSFILVGENGPLFEAAWR